MNNTNVIKITGLFLIGFVLFISCNHSAKLESDELAEEQLMIRSPAFDYQVDKKAEEPIERKLLKEGSVHFETNDIKETYTFITALCKEFNAYIASENQNNYKSRLEQDLTVRVPAEQLDAFIAKIEEHAKQIENKNVNVKDVTEEFIDTEARLKTKKALEARYHELLKQAKTVEDIISVESQLSTIRADIESMEGRLKYLRDRVSLSTLNISFYETIGTDFGFASKLADALKQGWDNLLIFIIGLIHIWPFILLMVLLIYFFIRWRKRKKLQLNTPIEK